MEFGVRKQLVEYMKDKGEAFDSCDLLDHICQLVKPHH